MIRVWGRTNSSNVMKVLWLLDELGLAHERIEAGGAFGGTDTGEFRAMNPFGQIPVLDDDGTTLFESNAILRYLINRHAPGHTLYPLDPARRGIVDAWLDAQQTALAPPQGSVFIAMVRQTPEQRDQPTLAKALAEAGEIWRLLDGRLSRQDYICGPEPTLADIAFGPHAHRWFVMPIERPDTPALRGWYQRLLTRPAYVARCGGPVR